MRTIILLVLCFGAFANAGVVREVGKAGGKVVSKTAHFLWRVAW